MPTAKRLIVEQPKDSLPTFGVNSLPKLAFDIESAVIKAGGKPGIDYTFKDIMEWAVSILASQGQSKAINELKSNLTDDATSMWHLIERKADDIERSISSLSKD